MQGNGSGPTDRTLGTPFRECISCPTVLSRTTDASHYYLCMIRATLHIADAVKLHPVSYVSSRGEWFVLHTVQGWAIGYLNAINGCVFDEVENHFVP